MTAAIWCTPITAFGSTRRSTPPAKTSGHADAQYRPASTRVAKLRLRITPDRKGVCDGSTGRVKNNRLDVVTALFNLRSNTCDEPGVIVPVAIRRPPLANSKLIGRLNVSSGCGTDTSRLSRWVEAGSTTVGIEPGARGQQPRVGFVDH
ncbi:hypothetical protein [Bradyrhizobium sp. 174]|uniref:hypothetical protein n=1 Tax=Bradyrhizobium sp. 174 TaxID=2782645 RepID=UPI0031F6AB28|nr:hypothetical protein [Bradyrhizobium sp. 174]